MINLIKPGDTPRNHRSSRVEGGGTPVGNTSWVHAVEDRLLNGAPDVICVLNLDNTGCRRERLCRVTIRQNKVGNFLDIVCEQRDTFLEIVS
jgi:hypothetical protein